MSIENAVSLLVEHRNGINTYTKEERLEASKALNSYKCDWIQVTNDPASDGFWLLIVNGNSLYNS